MATPITLTKTLFESLKDKIYEGLSKKSTTGKFTIESVFIKLDTKYVVEFTEKAYIKMLLITLSRDTEIGWSGVAERLDDTHFIIKDIVIPPQRVTGTTYRTDDNEYGEWLLSLTEEEYNNLRFNGHSHVNMSTSPSGMDMELQQDTVNQLGNDDYYIFIIFNKKNEMNLWVYDLKNNLAATGDELEVIIPDEVIEYIQFIKEANSKCVTNTGYTQSKITTTLTKEVDKPKKASSVIYGDDYDDEWDEEDYYRQMERYYGAGYMGLM